MEKVIVMERLINFKEEEMKKIICCVFSLLLIGGLSFQAPVLFVSNSYAAEGKYPSVYNVTLTDADTEYSKVLSPSTKKFTIQVRGSASVRCAFTTGKVAGSTNPYFTIKAGAIYWEDGLNLRLNSLTLYLASSTAGTVVEIIVWR